MAEVQGTTITERLDAINEFDRDPVSDEHLQGPGNFIGFYSGEHVAGTEFVIGPLFVAHGVSAGDLILGLLVGNLLAVLSWAFPSPSSSFPSLRPGTPPPAPFPSEPAE